MKDDESQEPTPAKRIQDAYEVGSINGGQDVVLNLRMEDGSKEWVSIHHTRVGEFVAGVMFASGIAARERPTKTPGGNPMPEQSSVVDVAGFNASAVPGEDFVVLRLLVGQGVNLDFRVPLSQVGAMQEKLSLAVDLARSGKSPVAH